MSLVTSLSTSFLQAFARVRPTQLQIYAASDGRMRLQIVASIASVTSVPRVDDEGRVHCIANAVFRAVKDGWRTESAGDLTLPGTIDRAIINETPFGRLVLWLSLPEDNAVIVFFPEHDTRTSERYRGNLEISRMELGSIAMQARLPQIVLDAERPPDDNG